jgi:PAS domain S-box-containing protein
MLARMSAPADDEPQHEGEQEDRRRARHWLTRGYLLALAVLVGSSVLVVLAWREAREREIERAELRFQADAQELVERVTRRSQQHELVLRGGVALFGTVARPTPRQWKAYVDGLDIGRRFPAVLGLGFAPYLTPAGLEQLQLDTRAAGQGLFEIRPHGVREHYGPILYLEPKTRENLDAIGFDMYSEPVRQAAMRAARDTGLARLTGLVHLVQDGGAPLNSVLLYAPVYRAGDVPGNVQARRLSMQGWVYMPFRVGGFLDATLGGRRGMRFVLHDTTDGEPVLLHSDPRPDDAPPPAFVHTVTVDLHGRSWRFDIESGPLDVAAPRVAATNTLLLLGLLTALLLFALALLLARTEARATAIATRMTENYRRSERRFRNAMLYSPIGKALLDNEGRIVEANPALGQILGRDPDMLVGERFAALFEGGAGADDADLEPVAEGVYRTTRQLYRHGELRHAQLIFAPVPGKIGQDVTRLVQVDDVTDRIRAEAKVHALNRTLEARVALRTRELSAANRELEMFAYNVSHDLRAPLRAIEGFSRLLVERYGERLDDAGRDYLDRVRKAASRMGDLIESMLKMSRLSRSELNLAELDLSRMAREIVAELRNAEPGRRVEVEIADGLRAGGDPTLVRNLLQNLLENAWKFTRGRDPGRIEVGPGEPRDDGAREFFVRDNGAGFAPEYADKLFRPFQRLHSESQFSGHGIGLASVKRIVDRHGGDIRAEGSEGRGATFWFSLPAELHER